MSKFKELENIIKETFKKKGYDTDVKLCPSNRKDLGDFQVNDAMQLAKIYHKSPIAIANEIKEELDQSPFFTNINIAGAGFINLTLTDYTLIEFINEIKDNPVKNIDKNHNEKVIIDYGGANVAKSLHVGHMRSANIGEGLKRLSKLVGNETISDVHLGDAGLQAGVVVMELEERFKDLPCFKEGYNGEDFTLPITKEDLRYIYPEGSKKIKESEEKHEYARQITYKIQNNHIGYSKLWEKVRELSIADIKETYESLNTNFDLWESEMDSFKWIPELLNCLNEKKLIHESEGAKVVDVKEEDDDKEMPPVLLQKKDGAYLYATTDLATIYSRMKRFNPTEIWYITDLRQQLHFEQVFRVAKKAKLVPNTKLIHLGFGTMNGKDGKPYKTRSGGVMPLDELMDLVKKECEERINDDIVKIDNKKETAEIIAVASLKYADLLPFRETDYIFDEKKFTDLLGKTGPYLLYSTVRINSLLNKAKNENIEYKTYSKIKNNTDREVIINLLELPLVIEKAYNTKSLNEIAEYIYRLTSSYNKFYAENQILKEEEQDLKNSLLILSKVIYETNILLLDTLGIKCPEKM